jgi:hypothetical protein
MFWGPRMQHIFRNALSSLTSTDGTTLAGVPRTPLMSWQSCGRSATTSTFVCS